MKIRSLTYFVKPRRWSLDEIEKEIEKAEEVLLELGEKVGEFMKVWTLRIAMPPVPQYFDPRKLLKAEPDGQFLYAAIHLNADDPRARELPDLMANSKVYGSIKVKEREDVKIASEIILRTSKMDVNATTRIAVIFGRRHATPYFPAACTRTKEGVAVALLYVEEAERDMGSGIRLPKRINDLGRFLEMEAKKVGTRFLGFDLSLSPWMEESAGRLVERVSGVRLPMPGTLEAISRINSYIRNLGLLAKVNMVGFNELMLPVGEDSLLKERVLHGEIDLDDLARLSSVCVAGVDMVAVERKWAEKWLVGYFLDLFEISKFKRRTMGVRVLPVDARPGDLVRFKKFGEIPVAGYRKI